MPTHIDIYAVVHPTSMYGKVRAERALANLIATPPAPATLPLETVDGPTASYLEVAEDQAIKQQKALADQIVRSGIVSQQEAQELAMSADEKPANLTWPFLIALVGVLATKLGSKLWK